LGRILRETKGTALDRLQAPNVLTAHLASMLRTMALDGRGLSWLPELLAAFRRSAQGDATEPLEVRHQ
jgi:LysR family transcriptional regulator, hypochlorite-specific transcription factor HypT